MVSVSVKLFSHSCFLTTVFSHFDGTNCIVLEVLFHLAFSSAVKRISIGAEGLVFDFSVGQTGRGVANGSPPLQRFFGTVLLKRYAAEMGTATRYTFQRNCARMLQI